MPIDPTRFRLPPEAFIQRLLAEAHPGLNTGPGSAIYSGIVQPMALVLTQPLRTIAVMRRNLSIANAPVMLEEELDGLAANLLYSRGSGSLATGKVRLYFTTAQAVSVSASAVFRDDAGRRWFPRFAVTASSSQVRSNQDPVTSEFYLDVTVIAEAVGAEYSATAGQITGVTGVLGVARVTNLDDFAPAVDTESNAQVAAALGNSITNRDLVKKPGIETVLRDEFGGRVRAVQVIGYGDPAMTRDTVAAMVDLATLLPRSFAQKYNVPLDADGNVAFRDANNEIIAVPEGGYVGAIRDLTGLDFLNVLGSLDAAQPYQFAVQPGMRFVLLQADGYSDDPDVSTFTVRRVVDAPAELDGEDVRLILLDRPFTDPAIATFDPDADPIKYPYTISGPVQVHTFHVGGQLDVRVDTTGEETRSVIVAALEEAVPSSGVYEVPLSTSVPLNSAETAPLFEGGQAFITPILTIERVEQVSSDNDLVVERTLEVGTHYTVIRAASRNRFTTETNDILRIKDDDSGLTFLGRRIKVTYVTNPDVPQMQAFVESVTNRDWRGAPIQILPPKLAYLDIQFSYRGNVAADDVTRVLREYINSRPIETTITRFDVESVLAYFGVTDIAGSLHLVTTRVADNGQVTSEVSDDRVIAEQGEKFRPAASLSVSQLS